MFESFVGGGGFGLHHVENFFMESLSQLFYLFHECHFTLSLKVYLLQESSSTTTFLSLILLLAAFFVLASGSPSIEQIDVPSTKEIADLKVSFSFFD